MKKTYGGDNSQSITENPSKVIIVPKPPKENKDTSSNKAVQDVVSKDILDDVKPAEGIEKPETPIKK